MKMEKKLFKLIFVIFTMIIIGNGSLFAADPGITKDSIKIGVFAPLSGPFQSYGIETWRGAMMWYKKVNQEGGIRGRKLIIINEDDKCTGTDLVAAVKKLVTKDEVFILNGGSCSSAIVSAQEYIERVKVPLVMLNASGDQSLYPPSKYIFGGISITQHAAGGSVIDFVIKHLKAKRIAYINHNDAYGSWNLETAEYQLKKLYPDATLVTLERIEREMTDATAVALKVKNSNPDVICIMTYDRPAALIIKSLYDLGVKVPYILGVTGNANLYNTAKAVGVKEAFQNFYYQDCIADAPDGPELAWARKMYAENYPDLAKMPEYPSPYMFTGITAAQIVCKGLEDSGPNPTREKFISAVENIKNLRGAQAGPISFSPDNRAAQEAAIFLKFDGEKAVKVPGSYRSIWKWEGKK
jgi:branched-chain amino acid transport system substrate-binding protein